MYFARALKRSDLVNGNVFQHGISRLNLAPDDLTTFVDPPDAALFFGFRSLDEGDPFEASVVVWMATLRRRADKDAIMESLQRVFTQLADQDSLAHLLTEAAAHARQIGYQKLWLVPALFTEPLLAPAVKAVSEQLGRPVMAVPSTGMSALLLS